MVRHAPPPPCPFGSPLALSWRLVRRLPGRGTHFRLTHTRTQVRPRPKALCRLRLESTYPLSSPERSLWFALSSRPRNHRTSVRLRFPPEIQTRLHANRKVSANCNQQ